MSQHEVNLFFVRLIGDQVKLIKKMEFKHPGLLVRLGAESDSSLSKEFDLSSKRIRQLRDRFGIPSPQDKEKKKQQKKDLDTFRKRVRSEVSKKNSPAPNGKSSMKIGGVRVVREDFVETWNESDSPQAVADYFGISASSSANPRAALCSAATILRKKGFTLKRFGRGRPRKASPTVSVKSVEVEVDDNPLPIVEDSDKEISLND